MPVAGADELEVMRARRDIDVAGLDDIAVRAPRHRHRALAVEPLGEASVKRGGMCWVIEDRRAIRRQAHEHVLERLDAAGRGADQTRSCRSDAAAARGAARRRHRAARRATRTLVPQP